MHGGLRVVALAARYDNTPYVRELFEHARILANRQNLFGFPEEPVDPRSATVASNAVQKLIEWAKSKRRLNSTIPNLKREETHPPALVESSSATPFVPLMSWVEIIAALNEAHGKPFWKNNSAVREKLIKLNRLFDGPIVCNGGRGTQPTVEKAKLLTWWAGLSVRFNALRDEASAKSESTRLTVGDTHAFGGSAIVVPTIGGSVKKANSKVAEKGKERER